MTGVRMLGATFHFWQDQGLVVIQAVPLDGTPMIGRLALWDAATDFVGPGESYGGLSFDELARAAYGELMVLADGAACIVANDSY